MDVKVLRFTDIVKGKKKNNSSRKKSGSFKSMREVGGVNHNDYNDDDELTLERPVVPKENPQENVLNTSRRNDAGRGIKKEEIKSEKPKRVAGKGGGVVWILWNYSRS